MKYQLPVVDDTQIWDVWMALYKVPAISVALELEIFESLDARPDTAEGLADRRDFDVRGLKALLAMLLQLDLLTLRGGIYQLAEPGRAYMLKNSPYFWGGVFYRLAGTLASHKLLLETINKERINSAKTRPVDGWESGHVDMEMARTVTAFMHSHSQAAAIGMTQTCDFTASHKVLDVGGGSGCFAIALALHRSDIHCTVMDLPTICTLAKQYIADAGVADRVNTIAVDMFREDWPLRYDSHFFSNVFHDWSIDTCVELARKSFAALPRKGRIFLHEMLLDDSGTAPAPAVAFSLLMAMGTKGQQFTFEQLADILRTVGFSNISSRNSYGYYSLVSAEKP